MNIQRGKEELRDFRELKDWEISTSERAEYWNLAQQTYKIQKKKEYT